VTHKWRNLFLTVALLTLFSTLLFGKLSAIQGYAVAIAL
jgi:hypothetical protein